MKKLISLISVVGLAFAPFEDILSEITPYLATGHYQVSCTSKTSKDKVSIPEYYAQITKINNEKFCDYNQVTINVSLPSHSFKIELPLSIESIKVGQYIDPKTIADIMFHNQSKCVLKLRPYRKDYDVGDAHSCDITDLSFWAVNVTFIFDNSSSPKVGFQELIGDLIKLSQKLYQGPEELDSNVAFVKRIQEYSTYAKTILKQYFTDQDSLIKKLKPVFEFFYIST